jgi:magnesium transporter
MIRTLFRNSKGNFSTDIAAAHWRAALRDDGGLLWVDIGEEPTETVDPLLRDIFNFHPLAIDDALRETHVPKIDNWGDSVYIGAHAVEFSAAELKLFTYEVDVFLGANFLVTLHRESVPAVNRLWTNNQADQRRLELGPDHLLYDLLDLITSVLFLPISFLAGVFGMNFLGIPFDSDNLLIAATLTMLGVPAGMLILFRRRGWF